MVEQNDIARHSMRAALHTARLNGRLPVTAD